MTKKKVPSGIVIPMPNAAFAPYLMDDGNDMPMSVRHKFNWVVIDGRNGKEWGREYLDENGNPVLLLPERKKPGKRWER